MHDEALAPHRATGRLAESAPLHKTILTVAPCRADRLYLVGLIAQQGGKSGLAVELISKAIRLKNDDPRYHFELGKVLKAQGRVDHAAAHYERAIALQPDHVDALNNLGIIRYEQGRVDEAVALYESALALTPNDPCVHNNLGIALVAQDRIDEAVEHYECAVTLRPAYAEAHNNLAIALGAQDRIDEAVWHYKRALALNPDYADAHNNLGNVLKARGEFADALAHYQQAITLQPDYAEPHFNRAEIKSFRRGDGDLEALEALANRNDLSASKAPYIHFGLAKALEDTGDYARCFEHLLKGNALKRRQIRYDEAETLEKFRRISAVFEKSLFEKFREKGDVSSVPVFVLGMPRSGSTLVEQILASHPQIQAAGELTALEAVAGAMCRVANPLSYPEYVRDLNDMALKRLGQSYLSRLPNVVAGKTRMVDKSPGNFLNVGLIRLILPNARIIHTRRNPVDTCVSCYSKLFSGGLGFTYDLAELGRYYRSYWHLMNHWRSVLPSGAMLDVSYEDVVEDLEGQAKRLIDYCGLSWDDRCLSFHKTSRAVKTASAVQVREPLFRHSMQRWRHYEPGLAPLLRELESIPDAGLARSDARTTVVS